MRSLQDYERKKGFSNLWTLLRGTKAKMIDFSADDGDLDADFDFLVALRNDDQEACVFRLG